MTKPSGHLAIIVVSYKDKNLFNFVSNLDANTTVQHSIEIFDQNPVKRENEFSGVQHYSYEHLIWDAISGPVKHKIDKVNRRMENADYICIITPDSVVNPGWDTELINFIDSKPAIVSGVGKVKIGFKNRFELEAISQPFNEFSMSQFGNKNFIFGKSEAFKKIRMPDFLKYRGEDEYWALAFMSHGYDIYSAPDRIYTDVKNRTIENTYHTFSFEHNYNILVDILHKIDVNKYNLSENAVDRFLEFHGLKPEDILRLPYENNDVAYDPYDLKMHDMDARRFIAGTQAVY
jgi:hypothetical protein